MLLAADVNLSFGDGHHDLGCAKDGFVAVKIYLRAHDGDTCYSTRR